MGPGRAAWKAVVARFGPAVLRPDRTIDRAALGAILFSDPAARRFVDGLVHPLVREDQERTARRLAREGRARIFVVEAALTIEAGYAGDFDRVVVVHCRRADQVRRLRERDGIGRADALRRIGTQMPVREKVKHADYTVDTSGSPAETVEQAERLYARLALDVQLKKNGPGLRKTT